MFDETNILNQIEEALKNLQDSDVQSVLNEINKILYPLKDSSVIEDYQFRAASEKNENGQFEVSVLVKLPGEEEAIIWDLAVG